MTVRLSFVNYVTVMMIAERLAEVRERVAAAAVAAGRDPATVKLLAVSKTVPAAVIAAAYAAGQRRFGENRVQELRDKAPLLPGDLEWHLIGQLQANKVRLAVRLAAWIHSVTSVALVERLARIAGEEQVKARILLEINMSGEESKSGAAPAEATGLLEAVLRSPHLNCVGLMTLAPFDVPEPVQRRVFGGLRELRDRLSGDFGVPLPELSMGMSDDFPAAIREGATVVRLGTAIFGGRA